MLQSTNLSRSICSVNSIKPFGITEYSIRQMMTYYRIHPRFLDIAFAFGRKSRNSDAGCGNLTVGENKDGAYGTQHSLSCYGT